MKNEKMYLFITKKPLLWTVEGTLTVNKRNYRMK